MTQAFFDPYLELNLDLDAMNTWRSSGTEASAALTAEHAAKQPDTDYMLDKRGRLMSVPLCSARLIFII